MRASKDRSATLAQPTDDVFVAVTDTVIDKGYEMQQRDDALRSVAFTSGKTAISWGQEFVVRVEPNGTGSTLQVTCGSLDDAPKALLDGWKGGKAADKFIAAVESKLASR